MKKLTFTGLSFSAIILLNSCTDLSVQNKDSLAVQTQSGIFTGVDAAATLNSSYADLRQWNNQENLYALSEVASDELLVPTRGTDWGDNGIWRSLHQQTWDPSHAYVLNAWNDLNANVFKVSQVLVAPTVASDAQKAEAKFLRAMNMFYVFDLFRQVPQRDPSASNDINPTVLTGQVAFDFIAKDLTEALPFLPSVGIGGTSATLKASKASCNFLIAKLFLNKHIYLGSTPAAADMNKVIQAVDAIKADGFDLVDASGNRDDYFKIFTSNSDTETLLWAETGVGNRMWCGLHYKQVSPDNPNGGWNGFSTTAEFYATFEGAANSNEPGNGQEFRRGYVPSDGSNLGFGYGFLVGQQYDKDGIPLKDRPGNPLVFSKDFVGIAGNTERNGIRILKYNPANGAYTNHYIIFRYADAHLMKAEAILRGGSSSSTALNLVNELRAKRGASAKASVDLTELLNERGRELYIEGWRRNDQIRFGTYTLPRPLKPGNDPKRVLFPIPGPALSSNPNLKQNPGY
jgi:starch-binding outer membrane protein, SusD/RagB family